MKRILLALLLAGVFTVSGMVANVMAQGTQPPLQRQAAPPSQPAATAPAQQIPVLIVDIPLLMKKHPYLFQQRQVFEGKMKGWQAELEAKRQLLQKQAKELEQMTAGTAGYSQKKDELVKKDAEIRADAMRYDEQAQNEEITVMYGIYVEIKTFVGMIAQQNNAIAVFPFTQPSTVMKPKAPNAEPTLQQMDMEIQLMSKQPLVWTNPAYDITAAVQQYIDQKYAALPKVQLDENMNPFVPNANAVASPPVPPTR
ncbi:MAG: OmpH family outer membrane protein [Planctomycetaceae bacterium]|nr:OmpH family outer membrane protein [Planctomycetaceae bacterium]